MQQEIKLSGTVEDIIFRNEENGYTVLEIDSYGVQVCAVGAMPYVNIGEKVTLTGMYKNHPTYGEQFSVASCEIEMPDTKASILKYLSSGAIKGIGASTAAAIVEEFGEDSLNVMKNEPKRLAKIKGISLNKAMEITGRLNEIYGLKDIMMYLEKYGIDAFHCVKVWKALGKDAIAVIENNPYILCGETIGISFHTADGIARDKEELKNSDYRIHAGLIHVLNHNRNNGQTCLPQDRLSETTAEFLEVDTRRSDEVLDQMVDDNILCRDKIGDRDFIFLPDIYKAEQYSADCLKMMLHFPPEPISDIVEEIEKIEQKDNIHYASLQRDAIEQALSKGLLILTGGPGTGKTTTLNAIIKILKKNGEKVFLAAPTGRAAQRMSALTGCEAKTIHRLLEVCWNDDDKPYFKKNEKNRLSCNALILDELSMIDSMLFESVLKALPVGCRLIMVGDCDQLPSVGAGNVLSDLILSDIIPVVQLKEIFRQSMQSLIVTNAHMIVTGEMPELNRRDGDFFFLPGTSPAAINKTIVELCALRLPKSYGYSPLEDI
ncbi:MAG: Flp pilus assembly complex ATPase component TadA, partial [Lachnospiraceae bacterium]|nr:Flp pilus assembly complex ATPase component TadA [Lachnospiraceae bacterium]